MDLPDQIEVEGQTWTLLEPGLYMTIHIGEIGPFTIAGAINGMAVYLETKLPHPRDPKRSHATYALHAVPSLKALAAQVAALAKEPADVA